MDDMVINFVTNIYYLICFLFFLIFLFHLLFIKIFKFDKVKFKKMEYFYLSAALIGIIGVSTDLRIWWTSSELGYSKQFASSAYGWVRDRVDNYYCMKFIRSPNSPDNFDEITKEHDAVCEWFKKVGELIPKSGDKLPNISFDKFPKIDVNNEMLINEISRFKSIISEYQRIRQDYFTLREKSKKNYFEIILSIFSPILICIALALRITKVTGEIKIERTNTLVP